MIKIMHTADVHLDSPFSSLNPRRAEIRRSELRAAFTSMMTYAKMNNTDLLLISGDLFDGEYVTRETVSLLCREFENYKNPVFIATGNHDPALPKSIWTKDIFPDNVRIFASPEVESYDIDGLGVTVYGYGFNEKAMESSPIDGLCVEDKNRVNLLLAHCDMLSPTSSTCPTTPDMLDFFGADYSALGHIHNPPEIGHDGRWCYPGCLEGRSFDECGPKGACIVEINKRGTDSDITIKRVRFSKKRYERGEVDVTGCESSADVKERIRAFVQKSRLGEDALLSLRLKGFVSPNLLLDTEELTEDSCGLFMLRLEDGTKPEINASLLEHDLSLRGEVYRTLLPMLNSSDDREREVAERALRYAFSALSGENPL